jgi:hypothetical protein
LPARFIAVAAVRDKFHKMALRATLAALQKTIFLRWLLYFIVFVAFSPYAVMLGNRNPVV